MIYRAKNGKKSVLSVKSTVTACALLVLVVLGGPRQLLAQDEDPGWPRLLYESSPAEQTAWGQRYEHAEGVPRDIHRAVQLYCTAARRGHAEAQYLLGWLYANGRGIERNDALAAAWFRLAAAQGDLHAKRMLARLADPNHTAAPLCISPHAREPLLTLHGGSSPERGAVEDAVRLLAPRYGLDPVLVLAIIEVESAYDPAARSHKGALGLMQLIPETATRFGVRDPLDPLENLQGGMAYLAWLLNYFKGDLQRALAGYNAGEKAVTRYGGIPPYPETRAYVKKVARLYSRGTGSRPLIATGS